jgi:hypothetical protein
MPGDRPMTPLRVTPALMLVMVVVLLAVGCSGEKQSMPQEKYIFLKHEIHTEGKTLAGDCFPVA